MAAQTELRSIINRVRNSANPEEFMQSVHLIRQGDLTFLIIHVPADHSDLSASYNNICGGHYYIDLYDLALSYYDQSVKIKLKTLPAEHPSTEDTYKNIGLVCQDKGELEEVLKLYKKSLIIYDMALLVNRPETLYITNNIQVVEDKMRRNK
ncbi:unnamed protein product [Rotaria socialis]|uniref:Tetratricopeptide repeat protein n=1 Tax=Rotaria socialis TaxID=392032 RepID=A0A820QRV7_9BILA|nr:unnamed protein product [Rotaria socialis]